MTSKQKQANILAFIENENRPLHDLIKRLCIGHLFVPKANMEITILLPDEKLTAILEKLESSQETIEECIKILQACVMLGYYTEPEDFQQNTISVVQGKVAPIPAKNLQAMKDFLPREYRASISVFKLSNQLPSPPADLSNEEDKEKYIKRKKKITSSDDAHKTFFDAAMKAKNKYEQTYVNLLMAMHQAADEETKTLIQSHLSYDTFATFYVLLKPNISDVKEHPYKSLFEICSRLRDNVNNISAKPSQKDAYQELMKGYESKIARNNTPIHTSIAPAIVYKTLSDYYADIKKRNPQHPRVESNRPEMMCAEDEFRMISFWNINNGEEFSSAQLSHYTLDKPKICSTNSVQSQPVYFSIAHAISRSDVLFYEPNRLAKESKDFAFFQNASLLLSIQKTEQLVSYFNDNN